MFPVGTRIIVGRGDTLSKNRRGVVVGTGRVYGSAEQGITVKLDSGATYTFPTDRVRKETA